MAKVRIPVPGSVGKSFLLDSKATEGATIGKDLKLPDGTIPATLAEFADALGIVVTSGGVGTDPDAEPGLGNPASDGHVLSSTTAGVRSWIAQLASTIYADNIVSLPPGANEYITNVYWDPVSEAVVYEHSATPPTARLESNPPSGGQIIDNLYWDPVTESIKLELGNIIP